MGFYSKSDREVEKIHKNATKENNYSTKHKAAREMEERGYEYGGFTGWTKKQPKQEEYTSEPLEVRDYALQPYLLMAVPFVAPLLMNPFIAVIYALLLPFVSYLLFNNRFLKDLLSLVPLYFFLGIWSLATLPFSFLPGIFKRIININVFSMIYSGYVLITNIMRWNDLRVDKGITIMGGIFGYDWRLMMQHADNALLWSIVIYVVIYIPTQVINKKKKQKPEMDAAA